MRSSILFCLALGLTAATAQAKGTPFVVVFPVVPLPGEADMASASAMTKAMLDDFKSENGFTAVPGELPTAPAPSQHRSVSRGDADYRSALAALKAGTREAARLRFPRAIRELRKGIDGVTRNLDALDNYNRLLKAYVLLAVAYFRRGKEANGTKVLQQLARLRPSYQLDPKKYPPLFLSIFARTRKQVLAEPRGSLEVLSTPPGAQVVLNGKSLGTTPLLIQSVVPGANHLVVRGGEHTFSDVVNVRSDATVQEHANLGGGASAPTLGDSIAANRFDAQVRKTARRLARDAGGDYVVVLAMGRGGGVFSVGGFLGDVHSRAWTALAPVSPDVDMLSANIEAHNLAREITAQIAKLSSGTAAAPGAGPVAFLAGKPIHSAEPERGAAGGASLSTVQFAPPAFFAAAGTSAGQPVMDSVGGREPIVPEAPVVPVQPESVVSPVSESSASAIPVPPPTPAPPSESTGRGPVVAVGPGAGQQPVGATEPGPRRSPGANGFPALASSRHSASGQTDNSVALPPLTAPPKPRAAPPPRAVPNDLGIEIVNTPPEATQPKSESIAAVQPSDSGAGSEVAGAEASVPKAQSGGLLHKWWFWTAIGVGAAAIAGGTYLIVRDQKPSSMVVMAVWK